MIGRQVARPPLPPPAKGGRHVVAVVALLPFLLSVANAERPLFNRDIRPILSDKCFKCHGPDTAARKADLRLDQREAALKAEAIVPGKPDDSQVVERIFSDDPKQIMPPPSSGKTLTAEQKELLRKW